MSILIVVESMFGNTRAVAEAVAAGLRAGQPGQTVDVIDAVQAPHELAEDLSLLLVGGPTRAFSTTRANAGEAAGDDSPAGAQDHREGIRHWIAVVTPRAELRTVTFDTRVRVPGLPAGSAAKSAAKALRERGFDQANRGSTFWVQQRAGPLDEGELARARAWGATLGRQSPT